MTFPSKDVSPGLGWPDDAPSNGVSGVGWPTDADGTSEVVPPTAPSGHASWGTTVSGKAETGSVPTGVTTAQSSRQGPQGSGQGESQLVRDALKDVDVSQQTSTGPAPSPATGQGKAKTRSRRGGWPRPAE